MNRSMVCMNLAAANLAMALDAALASAAWGGMEEVEDDAQADSTTWRDEFAVDDLCDSNEHGDEERGDWTANTQKHLQFTLEAEQTYVRTFAVYKGDTNRFIYDHRNKKTYNRRVVWNGEVKPLVKGNFKWRTVCNELNKLVKTLQIWTGNWRLTPNETRNQ
jgi:hypothetical protein